MTYELSKELKDAGFPQDNTHFKWLPAIGFVEEKVIEEDEDGKPVVVERAVLSSLENEVQLSCDYAEEWRPNMYAAPNLSELIEACGDAFYGIYRADGLWHASAGKDAPPESNLFLLTFDEEGSTPEEAVARLWLALNKKS